jgi:hypothetical protein
MIYIVLIALSNPSYQLFGNQNVYSELLVDTILCKLIKRQKKGVDSLGC